MATVRIPAALRTLTQGRAEVTAEGASVAEVLRDLDLRFPGLAARVLDEHGALRRYVNVFHNDEDIRYLQGLATPVAAADRLTIVPAVAGGA